MRNYAIKHLLITIAAVVLVGCGNENDVKYYVDDSIVNDDTIVSVTSKYRGGKILFKVILKPMKG